MTKQVPYTVIKKINEIELRQYPEICLAVVKDQDDDTAFGYLFRYISGENKTRRRIPMTTPVITSGKIKMTAPVITRANFMAFALPSSYTKDTVPIPTNPLVTIEVQPKKIIAVLRFSGRTPDAKVQQYREKLISSLKEQNILVNGETVLMRYNSPFTPGFLRRNEVAVEIQIK